MWLFFCHHILTAMPAAFKILTIRCCFFWSICDFLLIVVPIILVLLNQANFNFPVSLNTLLSTSGWLMAPLSTSPRILGLLKTLLCKASLEFVMTSSINVAVLVYLSLSEKKKKRSWTMFPFFFFGLWTSVFHISKIIIIIKRKGVSCSKASWVLHFSCIVMRNWPKYGWIIQLHQTYVMLLL